MEDQNELKDTEFAIQRSSTFSLQMKDTQIELMETGDITVTLIFKIEDTRDIQNIPGEILIGACGIFEKNKGNKFDFDKESSGSNLTLEIDDADRIILISDEKDYLFMTKGVKGRQGNTLLLRQS